MKLTNDFGLSKVVFEYAKMSIKEYDRGDSDASVTGVGLSPRQYWLTERYYDKIVRDISKMTGIIFGNALHGIMEKVKLPGLISEKRYFLDIGGYKISGKPDAIFTKERYLEDFKSANIFAIKYGRTPEDYIGQGNLYRLLLNDNGIPIDKCVFPTFLKDWRKGEHRGALKKGLYYPERNQLMLDIPLGNVESTRATVLEKLNYIFSCKDMDDDQLPSCTKEERWHNGADYAVFNTAGKMGRAAKCFKVDEYKERGVSEEQCAMDASKYATDKGGAYKVIYRKGENVRCMEWCDVSKFCNQWTKLQKENK